MHWELRLQKFAGIDTKKRFAHKDNSAVNFTLIIKFMSENKPANL